MHPNHIVEGGNNLRTCKLVWLITIQIKEHINTAYSARVLTTEQKRDTGATSRGPHDTTLQGFSETVLLISSTAKSVVA